MGVGDADNADWRVKRSRVWLQRVESAVYGSGNESEGRSEESIEYRRLIKNTGRRKRRDYSSHRL